MDKINHMQDRLKSRLGVETAYKGPDPACMAVEVATRSASDACREDAAAGPAGAVGHEFEFLGAPHDYPDCRYCWVVEENDVLMWIVLPNCGTAKNNITLAF